MSQQDKLFFFDLNMDPFQRQIEVSRLEVNGNQTAP